MAQLFERADEATYIEQRYHNLSERIEEYDPLHVIEDNRLQNSIKIEARVDMLAKVRAYHEFGVQELKSKIDGYRQNEQELRAAIATEKRRYDELHGEHKALSEKYDQAERNFHNQQSKTERKVKEQDKRYQAEIKEERERTSRATHAQCEAKAKLIQAVTEKDAALREKNVSDTALVKAWERTRAAVQDRDSAKSIAATAKREAAMAEDSRRIVSQQANSASKDRDAAARQAKEAGKERDDAFRQAIGASKKKIAADWQTKVASEEKDAAVRQAQEAAADIAELECAKDTLYDTAKELHAQVEVLTDESATLELRNQRLSDECGSLHELENQVQMYRTQVEEVKEQITRAQHSIEERIKTVTEDAQKRIQLAEKDLRAAKADLEQHSEASLQELEELNHRLLAVSAVSDDRANCIRSLDTLVGALHRSEKRAMETCREIPSLVLDFAERVARFECPDSRQYSLQEYRHLNSLATAGRHHLQDEPESDAGASKRSCAQRPSTLEEEENEEVSHGGSPEDGQGAQSSDEAWEQILKSLQVGELPHILEAYNTFSKKR